jgi:hypothetical protein
VRDISHQIDGRREKLVGLICKTGAQGLLKLFSGLAEIFPIEVEVRQPGEYQGLAGLIIVQSNGGDQLKGVPPSLPVYAAVAEENTKNHRSAIVQFTQSSVLEECFRGRAMTEFECRISPRLQSDSDDGLVASLDGAPIWVSRQEAGARIDTVAMSLPLPGPYECLRDHFRGGKFIELLPLMSFLQALTQDLDWSAVRIPACFVFDDPSLYSGSYGFINYQELADHTREQNYFASVATIPLDCWRPNLGTIEIFRNSAPRLSLVMHGNNHTYEELAQSRPGQENLYLLAEALRRWERLEREHGLALSRIMEAPHGAITEAVLAHMLLLGYEATLGTPNLVFSFNCNGAKGRTIGFDRADFMAGMPIIPRIRMSAEWKTDVLLAAFLRQPIILAGHHWDAAGELALLADFARVVNSLKSVVWASPLEIARTNFKSLRDAAILHLKVYSRKIRLEIPEGVNSLVIHRPWLEPNGSGEALTFHPAENRSFDSNGMSALSTIRVTPHEVLEINCVPLNSVDYRTVTKPRRRYWPVVRKIFMEVRDRTAPLRS